jgi:hypothetical protein
MAINTVNDIDSDPTVFFYLCFQPHTFLWMGLEGFHVATSIWGSECLIHSRLSTLGH